MPVRDKLPNNLRAFADLGLDLSSWEEDDEQVTTECPFCGREDKFSIKVEDTRCRCWSASCEAHDGMNVTSFLRRVLDRSEAKTNGQINEILEDRRLLFPDTLMRWRVAKSFITGDWIVPGYSTQSKGPIQLYRYLNRTLFPLRNLGHGFHRETSGDKRGTVFVCEGPWDAMALWEVLKSSREGDGGLEIVGSETSSLLQRFCVMAVPGCGSIGKPFERWTRELHGRRVVLAFDNDWERGHAGLEATKRAAKILSSVDEPPASLHWIRWGRDGWTKDLPSGYDVRDDLLSGGVGVQDRIRSLEGLLGRIEEVPKEWTRNPILSRGRGEKTQKIECKTWKELVSYWRKAMRWIGGLDLALSAMIATSYSTRLGGKDQLWIKVLGPPSCGKSSLCEAMSLRDDLVVSLSTMKKIYSGYQVDREGSEDMSLAARMIGRTLIVKDVDPILQSPERAQIMGQFRDWYDKVGRSHFNNMMSREYKGPSTVILCGTAAIREMDTAELGGRYLDVQVMHGIDEELEDAVADRVVEREEKEISGVAESEGVSKEELEARAATAYYLGYLIENADVSKVLMSPLSKSSCARLGKLVAYLRARPSKKQSEVDEREFAGRLPSQLTRLAKCLGAVLNRDSVDEEVMRRVRRVARDTCKGKTLDLARHLKRAGEGGATASALSVHTGETPAEEGKLLRFLMKIGAVEKAQLKKGGATRWKLTPRLESLIEELDGV